MILDGNLPQSIDAAVAALEAGELVGLPTETVYGLAADACNPTAVAKIFSTKGRPADHPLIVHLAEASTAAEFASQIPGFAQRLIDAFWPGPLTLILPRRADVAQAAAGGHDSIGLRCPSHPVAHALLRAAAERGIAGVAAPSANRFGRVSPTTAAHVAGEFGPSLLVLDGGPCTIGIESAIIDCTRGAPVVLRPGQLSRQEIERVAGARVLTKEELSAPDPQAPGTLSAHYAPAARVRLMAAGELRTALDLLGADAKNIAVWSRAELKSASRQIVLRRMPSDAAVAAQQLFAVLRDFDEEGVRLIWVETPPDTPEWEGVHDRLARAAASA
ncbi:L-threonylcarbamoyladenylate synthase [Ottowia thiooxydans]|uniref:L-threonylcarbamoyladenylate synthase n=1 Tax=Ottowia thiooxydans TaxID=219182 RepID=UPI0003FBFEE4|nr:L-threonylcarbamoyladenylate synthase [Ottowia thiooxydans]